MPELLTKATARERVLAEIVSGGPGSSLLLLIQDTIASFALELQAEALEWAADVAHAERPGFFCVCERYNAEAARLRKEAQ